MQETRITFTLNKLVSVLNSHADSILRTKFDMTYSQFLFLLNLQAKPSSLTELAGYLKVSTAAVSKRVTWFTDRGLVEIVPDSTNARKVVLKITKRGEKSVQKASTQLEASFNDFFAGYKGVKLGELNKNLNSVLEHLLEKPMETQ